MFDVLSKNSKERSLLRTRNERVTDSDDRKDAMETKGVPVADLLIFEVKNGVSRLRGGGGKGEERKNNSYAEGGKDFFLFWPKQATHKVA